MKLIVTIIAFSFFKTSFSQSFKKVEQPELNVEYKLPESWEVDGFGSSFDDWEGTGSAVCSCGGTINFGYNRKLGMVIYPVGSKSDKKKRENIWHYHFVPEVKNTLYKTKSLTFKKTVSKWELPAGMEDGHEILDNEVWNFTVNGSNYGFIIYFWGKKELIKENEKVIAKILDSFTQLKK